ncbi:hypothetical protein OQA88_11564 [Cercophora sp. LCS_1]
MHSDDAIYRPLVSSLNEIRLLTILPESRTNEAKTTHCSLATFSLTDFSAAYRDFLANRSSDATTAAPKTRCAQQQEWIRHRSLVPQLSSIMDRLHASEPSMRMHRFAWGDFSALSYSPSRMMARAIHLLNGRLRSVTPNLAAALARFAEAGEFDNSGCLDGRHKLWVDALCINQDDPVERAAEVRRMRDIYGLAWSVVVWLGEPSFGSARAMQLLRTLGALARSGCNGTMVEASLRADRNVLGCGGAWLALHELMNRPYWSRLWIVQETTMGASATWLRCGHDWVAKKLEPNYTIPVSDAYAVVARTFIQVYDNLEPLREGNPWGPSPNPTWAADWLWRGRLRFHAPKVRNQVPEYIALSYVWGTVDTETGTLSYRTLNLWREKRSIDEARLPRTVRDAITVTKMLQKRYLWADRMCILQEEASEEQAQAVRYMDWVYMNAFCTIVAPEAEDSRVPFPGLSGSPREVSQVSTTISGVSLATVPANPGHRVTASFWLTRPWTFQEMVCSPRAIVFTPEVALFCCANGCTREDTLESVTITKDDAPVCEPITVFETEVDGAASTRAAGYYEKKLEGLVRQYISRTTPRKPADWGNAFQGILVYLGPILGESVCGTPLNIIHNMLAWHSDTYQAVRGRSHGDLFPSWSWTGWMFSTNRPNTFQFTAGTPALALFRLIRMEKGTKTWGYARVGPEPDLSQWSSNFIHDHFKYNKPPSYLFHDNSLDWDFEGAIRTAEQSRLNEQLLIFYTSAAKLEVRDKGPAHGGEREKDSSPSDSEGEDESTRGPPQNEFHSFGVWSPKGEIATIKLPAWQIPWREYQDRSTEDFIVIHCDDDGLERRLLLMMISTSGGVSYRVQVTDTHVTFRIWRDHVRDSYRRLVILG